tara:strand:- start:1708 stop:2418 length:711 start_codon:yes stop_codon:yes gene_type:complete
MHLKLKYLCIPLLFLTSCAQYIEDRTGQEYDKKALSVHEPESKPESRFMSLVKPPTGSIFASAKKKFMLGGDNRAITVGDILRVNFNEKVEASKNQAMTTAKNSSLAATIPLVTGLLAKQPERLDRYNGTTQAKTFAGSGSASLKNSLTGEVAVTVVRQFPNGNLEVAGQKKFRLADGVEYVRVKGIARPTDITSDNVIESKYLANAEITYVGTGSVSNDSKKGWLLDIIGEISPL